MSPTGILICCMVPSEAVPFVYLASVCWSLQCLISALTQAGGGGLLFRLLVPWRCGEGLTLLSPSAAQAPGRSIWSGPCVAYGSSFQVLHKSADSVVPPFCAFPSQSGPGSQGLDQRTLPGFDAPFPLRGPRLSFCTRPGWVPAACVKKLGACLQCGRGCLLWG